MRRKEIECICTYAQVCIVGGVVDLGREGRLEVLESEEEITMRKSRWYNCQVTGDLEYLNLHRIYILV